MLEEGEGYIARTYHITWPDLHRLELTCIISFKVISS